MSADRYDQSAFPIQEVHRDGSPRILHMGMLLRDYFAAKALQGMLADSEVRGSPAEFATRSYTLADAMLEARVK
jgi:hypothetical protein